MNAVQLLVALLAVAMATHAPSPAPTVTPTQSQKPTIAPTYTFVPSQPPSTIAPTYTFIPTQPPSTQVPSVTPTTRTPTSFLPTVEAPTESPTTLAPTQAPSYTMVPSAIPTSLPSSAPSFIEETTWGQITWDKRRHRTGGLCENSCSGHGTCQLNNNCLCYTGLSGEAEWTGPDCSMRMCPRDYAWVGSIVNQNNLHPWAECSNKGVCDRKTGSCQCFPGYDGVACQRTVCPNNCNDRGTCWPEKHLASKVGRVYSTPWDSMKHVGCLCDAGYRGPACDQQECPSGLDPLAGYGNEAGRECSGRGLCDYTAGTCQCFSGFFGTRCQHQTTLI